MVRAMASIRSTVRKDGTETHTVLFRHRGTQRSKTFDTRKNAEHFIKVIDVHGVDGALELASINQGAVTLDMAAEAFFEWKLTGTRKVRSDRTVADYRRDYANWIAPTLGRRPLEAVTEVDVQRLVDAWSAQLSPKSVADRHAILHGIFKWAGAPSQRWVTGDPCLFTDLPERHKKRVKGLRPNQWVALYSAVKAISPDAADLIDFLLATGWRWSEAIALTLWDVEDNGYDTWVTMTQVVRRNANNQHVIVEDAKSDDSLDRRVKLDRVAAEVLRRRIGNRVGGGLVFTTAAGKQWHYTNFRRDIWDPARAAAGLERPAPETPPGVHKKRPSGPTPHDLRHTHIAWHLMGGEGITRVQHRVGHASIKTTEGYATMIDDVSDAALDRFAQMRQGTLNRPELPSS